MPILVQCPEGHVYTAQEGSGLEQYAQESLQKHPDRQTAWIGSDACKACKKEQEINESKNKNLREVEKLSGRNR